MGQTPRAVAHVRRRPTWTFESTMRAKRLRMRLTFLRRMRNALKQWLRNRRISSLCCPPMASTMSFVIFIGGG